MKNMFAVAALASALAVPAMAAETNADQTATAADQCVQKFITDFTQAMAQTGATAFKITDLTVVKTTCEAQTNTKIRTTENITSFGMSFK